MLRETLRRQITPPDAFRAEDIERCVEAWSQPGALGAAINYYRAAFSTGLTLIRESQPRIEQPVLVICGECDPYLGPELAQPDPRQVSNPRVVRLPEMGHWVHWEAPEQVSRLLVEFLEESTSPAPGRDAGCWVTWTTRGRVANAA